MPLVPSERAEHWLTRANRQIDDPANVDKNMINGAISCQHGTIISSYFTSGNMVREGMEPIMRAY